MDRFTQIQRSGTALSNNGDSQATIPESDEAAPPPDPNPPDLPHVSDTNPEDPKAFRASIYQYRPLSAELIASVRELEEALEMRVFLLLQNGPSGKHRSLMDTTVEAIFRDKHLLPENEPVALLIDSNGGQARASYRIVNILRNQCGDFVSIVPRYAKSAATLLALGGGVLLLGNHAELGPMDVQIWDDEQEAHTSALNELQSIEQLHTAVLGTFDETMILLTRRTGRKIASNIPHALSFIASMYGPLIAKSDVLRYTQRARQLKVGQDYLARLLLPRYDPMVAQSIAGHLVRDYADHGFIIDHAELERLLELAAEETVLYGEARSSLDPIAIRPEPEIGRILDRLYLEIQGVTAIGLLCEENAS